MKPRELYQLPREEFTAARNAAAAEQKKAGDAQGAKETRALPKPGNAAWLVNRAAAEDRPAAKKLLAAGERLRKAYGGAAGKGGPDRLRKAIEAEKAAVDALVKRAGKLAEAAGIRGDALDRVRETLHSLGSDDDVRNQFEAGILAGDHRAAGFAGVVAPGDGPASPRGGAARRRRIAKAEERVDEAAAALDDARARLKEAENELAEAAEEQRLAKRQLAEARDVAT